MALSGDLRERVVGAVVEGGMSRNAAAKRFGVSIASAVRWVARFKAKGEVSPAPTGGDRRSGRIEAHRDYLLGLIRRRPDMTLLEIQERLIANCGERFSSSVLWRFFDRHEITFKKSLRMLRSSNSYTEGFSHFVTSMTAPVASGWSVCRVGLAPTGKRRLVTAHT